jgi:phytoene dehydrogenase-like protein
MAAPPDIVIIGAGVNGLTCAASLAERGLKPLVLERQAAIGGCCQTTEIAPGFNVPLLSHAAGPLRRDVIEDLQLRRHGLDFIPTDITAVGIDETGQPLVLYRDTARTADELRRWSTHDAERWPRFSGTLGAIGRVVGSLLTSAPPPLDDIRGRDLWSLMHTLRAFRALDKSDAYRLLRWGPMAVADLVSEAFENERLRVMLAADGIFGAQLGPWSAGSGLLFLLRAANAAVGQAGGWFARGGPGAIATALERAVTAAGGEIRVNTSVARILVRDERARGVVLADGTEIAARAIVSAVDPRRTFLSLCDPIDLAPEFLWRMRHYRSSGTVAKVNLALSALPAFTGLSREHLGARIRTGAELDDLERAYDHAKYGRYSTSPFVEFTMPSVIDPALAPAGGHVLSAYVQFAPYSLRDSTWDEARDGFGRLVVDTLERLAPGLSALVVAQQVLTPLDLERTYGLTGGHIFHGELALDQLLSMRPLLGWGGYRAPIRDLYLCSSGTHPGTGLTGGSGRNAAREIIRQLK